MVTFSITFEELLFSHKIFLSRKQKLITTDHISLYKYFYICDILLVAPLIVVMKYEQTSLGMMNTTYVGKSPYLNAEY